MRPHIEKMQDARFKGHNGTGALGAYPSGLGSARRRNRGARCLVITTQRAQPALQHESAGVAFR